MSRAAWGGRKVAELRAQTLATYGTVCHLCGQDGADCADHVIPRSKGGTNTLDNLRPAHHDPCNRARGDMDLADWFRTHPAARPVLAPSREW